MPDVSKLRIDDTVYDIKDSYARNRLVDIDESLDNLDTSIDNRFDSFNTSIDNRFANLDAKIHGSIIVQGDSYNNPSYGNWGSYLLDYLGYSSSNSYNIYTNGGSFYSGTFLNRITDLAESMTETQKTDIGMIVLLAGINDAHTDVTDFSMVSTGIANYCSYCKTTFPNAQVYIGFIGNSRNSSSILNGRTHERIMSAYQKYAECGEFGAKFIANLEYIMRDYSVMIADGIHPNLTGGAMIAKYASAAIRNGGCSIKRYLNTQAPTLWTFDSNVTSGITFRHLAPASSTTDVRITVDNGITDIQWRSRLAMVFSSATTIAQGQQYLAGILNCDYWNGKPSEMIILKGRATDGTNYYPVTAHLLLNSSNTFIRLDGIGNNWAGSVSNITQILFDPWRAIIPTMMA